MDGIANVARQQQSQASTIETTIGKAAEHTLQAQPKHENVVKELQQEVKSRSSEITSEKDVQKLVSKLNKAMQPMGTDLKYGVDSQDIFYVSVIDQKTDKMIRRFPAEQAHDFLPKMQEVSGILFDTKG